MALAISFALAMISLHDPGYVLISRAPFQIEVSLALFVVLLIFGFIAVYLIVRLLFRTFQARRDVAKWNNQRATDKAGRDVLFGYAKLIEGNWQEAERELMHRIEHSSSPLLNHLGAAYAAQQSKRFEKRDHYLDLAFNCERKFRDAVQLTRIRLQYQAGQFEDARLSLNTLSGAIRKRRVAQRMEAEISISLQNWQALVECLPLYRKSGHFNDAELLDMETTTFSQLLVHQNDDENGLQASKTWALVPKNRRKDPQLIEAYCRKLIAVGKLAEAETQIKAALAHEWSSWLVVFYGDIDSDNTAAKLKQCEIWEKQHANDASLSLTIARLRKKLGDLSAAQDAYVASLREGASEEAFLELGQVLEQNGEVEEARRCYKRGLEFTLNGGAERLAVDKEEAEPLLLGTSSSEKRLTN